MNETIKVCSRCRVNPIRTGSTKGGSSCKQCHAAYMRDYSKRTNYKDVKQRKARLRNLVLNGKRKPCADCGQEYPWYVMEYDHVRGQKLFLLSKASSMRISEQRIIEEMAKCDVVCSNCHRERTYRRGDSNFILPDGVTNA